jgi:16S rRNA (guanine1207-N2)-methyltransferase
VDIKICTTLLEEHMTLEPNHHIALCFAPDASFAYLLAQSVEKLDIFDLHHSEIARLRKALGNKAPNLTLYEQPYPEAPDLYDSMVVLADKGREYSRAYLWRASHVLKQDGALYIAGESQRGTKPLMSDAEAIFHNSNTLIYKKRHRVGISYKEDVITYPADWEHPSPDQARLVTYDLPDGEFDVYTQPGVFSWEALDDGTRYLLETFDLNKIPAGTKVLDMGCGTGIIGAWLAKQGADVTLVDDNLLAVGCAKRTLAHHDLQGEVKPSNVFSNLAGEKFDLIISNPPFHKSFDVNTNVPHQLITQASEHLNPNGRLIIVANVFLKYDTLAKEHFKSVSIQHNERYKIVEARA